MEENKIETNVETMNHEETAGQQIVIQEESMGKKILKGVVKGLVVLASSVAGFFIGRATKGSDDSSEEGPKE